MLSKILQNKNIEMKRIMIIVASLSGLVSYAQSRESAKVGINTTTPQATMEVQVGASNLTGTTNEGIIAPRLSKERIANIENPVEGTLLYATDNVYAPAVVDATISERVADITEKGYYFYNGSKWIGWRDPEVYKDYNLSRDRRVFLDWLNTDVTDIDMEADPDLKKVKVIGRKSLSDKNLISVVLPDGLEIIREHAFSNNKLTTVAIPNSVTSIGENAFGLNKLTSVTIGNGVTSIGRYAFSSNKLTNVTIGNSVTSIGEDAFYGYTTIELLKISAPVPPTMEGRIFYDTPHRIVVPMASVAAYKAANGWSDYANVIEGE